VPFYAVARAEEGVGYATIKRRDRQRVINVTADVNREEGNEGEILSDLESGYLPELVAAFPGLSYSFEGAQREQRKAMGSLARNYLFAIVAIYALLAVPLRSYGQPLIIMAVIPFGLVGAVIGHLIRGIDLSMMSVWGIVALTGVVVNASLVLVHSVNQHRTDGVPLDEAVRHAGVSRFRPIVLTALTTFVGLLPLLFERSVSSRGVEGARAAVPADPGAGALALQRGLGRRERGGRAQVQGDLRAASQHLEPPDERGAAAGGEGHPVRELEGCVAVLERRAQDVRAGQVRAARRAPPGQLQREGSAGFRVEQTAEQRRGVEALGAPPVDRARAADESCRAAVAEDGVVLDAGSTHHAPPVRAGGELVACSDQRCGRAAVAA
jgi:hypothetical protein